MIKLTSVTQNGRVTTPPALTSPTEKSVKAKASQPATASTEQTMMQARQTLSAMPDVDNEKVAQVKAALSRGEITLDSQGLSQAMLSFFQGSE